MNEKQPIKIVKTPGQAYYFSHETIKQMKSGELVFLDIDDNELKPVFFGAGLNGMNGVLERK